jgi:subfamily B ATP-binding cassette protein MsbA
MPTNPGPASASESARGLTLRVLLAPYWKALALGLAAVAAETGAGLLEPWPLKIVLDSVLHAKKVPGWLAHTIASTLGTNSLAVLHFAALAIILIAVTGAVGTYVEKQTIAAIGLRVMHELRRMLFWHVQRLSMAYHDNKRTGDVISTITTDIDAVQSAITAGVLDTLYYALTLLGMMAIMLYLDWRFTLIALSVLPALFVVVYTFTGRIKQAARDVRKAEAEVVSTLLEVLSSIRIVKAFGREEYEQRRFESESQESVDLALHARTVKAKLTPYVEMIVACGTAIVLWFGSRQALAGALTPGLLIVFLLYLGKMYKPIRELSKMSDTYSRAIVAWERIRDSLAIDIEVRDAPGARPAPAFKGAIELDHVTFAYADGRTALRNLSLAIEPGQRAAVVGPTGSGKTTLISLIPRFYDPQSGQVKIDGVDVRTLQRKTLRRQISLVLQDTLLFRGTVSQNIAYAKPEATSSEIEHAARVANAEEFIRELPLGYATLIGERGVTLSAGQRQRIAIARAVLRDTPILILDEPSTALDAASEKLVLEALERLREGKTTITIAHRLTAIQNADVIFVLKDGAVLQHGTHAELIAAGGLYAGYYELQLRESAVASSLLIGAEVG